jgi:hypothetical protein
MVAHRVQRSETLGQVARYGISPGRAREGRWNPGSSKRSAAPPGLGAILLDPRVPLRSPLRCTLGYHPSSLRD